MASLEKSTCYADRKRANLYRLPPDPHGHTCVLSLRVIIINERNKTKCKERYMIPLIQG